LKQQQDKVLDLEEFKMEQAACCKEVQNKLMTLENEVKQQSEMLANFNRLQAD